MTLSSRSEVSTIANIERDELPKMVRIGIEGFYCSLTEPRPNEVPIAGAVEVVPATDLRGAVEERDALRAAVTHVLAQGSLGKQSKRRLRAALASPPAGGQ